VAEEDKITTTDQVEEEEEGVEVETNQTISSKARDTWLAGGLDVPHIMVSSGGPPSKIFCKGDIATPMDLVTTT